MDPVVEASAFIAHRWHKPTQSRTSDATASLHGAAHVFEYHQSKRDQNSARHHSHAPRSLSKPQHTTTCPDASVTLFAYQPLYCEEFIDAHGVDFVMSKTPRERSSVPAIPTASSRKRPQSATAKRVTASPVAARSALCTGRNRDAPADDPVAAMIYGSPCFKQRSLQVLEAETYRLLDQTRSTIAWDSSDRAPRGPALSAVRRRNDGKERAAAVPQRPTLSQIDRACHRIYKFVCRQYLRRKRDRLVQTLQASHPNVREFSDGVIAACRMFASAARAKPSHVCTAAADSDDQPQRSHIKPTKQMKQGRGHTKKPAKKTRNGAVSPSTNNSTEAEPAQSEYPEASGSGSPPKHRKRSVAKSARCTMDRSDPLKKLRRQVVSANAGRKGAAPVDETALQIPSDRHGSTGDPYLKGMAAMQAIDKYLRQDKRQPQPDEAPTRQQRIRLKRVAPFECTRSPEPLQLSSAVVVLASVEPSTCLHTNAKEMTLDAAWTTAPAPGFEVDLGSSRRLASVPPLEVRGQVNDEAAAATQGIPLETTTGRDDARGLYNHEISHRWTLDEEPRPVASSQMVSPLSAQDCDLSVSTSFARVADASCDNKTQPTMDQLHHRWKDAVKVIQVWWVVRRIRMARQEACAPRRDNVTSSDCTVPVPVPPFNTPNSIASSTSPGSNLSSSASLESAPTPAASTHDHEIDLVASMYQTFHAAKAIQRWYLRHRRFLQSPMGRQDALAIHPPPPSSSASPVAPPDQPQHDDGGNLVLATPMAPSPRSQSPQLDPPIPPFNTANTSVSTTASKTPQSPQDSTSSAGASTTSSNEVDTVASMYQVYHAARAIQRWWHLLSRRPGRNPRTDAAATTIQRQYRLYVTRGDLRVALKALLKAHRRQTRRQMQRSTLVPDVAVVEETSHVKHGKGTCLSWHASVWVVVMVLRLVKWRRRSAAIQSAALIVQRQFRVHGRRRVIAAGVRLLLLHKARQANRPRDALATDEDQSRRAQLALDYEDRWDEYTDPTSGAPYFYNPSTGETRWKIDETRLTVDVDHVSDDGDYVIAGLAPSAVSTPRLVASAAFPATPDPAMETDANIECTDGMWTQVADASGCVYYFNSATNATSWDPPRQSVTVMVDEGWQTFANEDGVPFYHNASTGETTWTLPPL